MLPPKSMRPPTLPSQKLINGAKLALYDRCDRKLSANQQSQKSIRPSSINKQQSISVRAISREASRQRLRSANRIRRSASIQKIRDEPQYKNPLPLVTSKNWGIFQLREKKMLAGSRLDKRRQMASLTKIMNFVTILGILKTNNINPKNISVPVCERSASIPGTTAKLKKGDILSLHDLFYGMMLPSGNDAAYQIAVIGGCILKIIEEQPQKTNITSLDINNAMTKQKELVFSYLKAMNKKCLQLEMKRSKWSNPHGLSNKENFTTVEDLFILCSYAMKIKEFRDVVATIEYSCRAQLSQWQSDENIEPNSQVRFRQLAWQNTNKMLWKGWSGIKTGITPNAGPCLAASVIKTVNGRQRQYLVILGSCISMQKRWSEVQELVEWAIAEY